MQERSMFEHMLPRTLILDEQGFQKAPHGQECLQWENLREFCGHNVRPITERLGG